MFKALTRALSTFFLKVLQIHVHVLELHKYSDILHLLAINSPFSSLSNFALSFINLIPLFCQPQLFSLNFSTVFSSTKVFSSFVQYEYMWFSANISTTSIQYTVFSRAVLTPLLNSFSSQ